jgi:pimeloyl-ACP methyl ester carboxylesterase
VRPGSATVRALVVLAAVVLTGGCRSAPPPVESLPDAARRTTLVDGVEIVYFDFNSDAAGTPLLYIHGYSGTGYEMFFLQDDLGRRIIAPDLPGLGMSGKPDVDYNLSYYLDFLRGFIRELGLLDIVLVGHSMGGKFAAVYAALEGCDGMDAAGDGPRLGRVEKLILIAPYGLQGEAGDIVEFLSNTGSLVDVSFTLHSQTLVDVAVRLNVFHDKDRIPQDLVDYVSTATFHSEHGRQALANITRNAIAQDPIDWLLPEICIPTLLIWGDHDRVLSFRHAEEFQELIQHSSLVRVNDCGHMPHVEQQSVTAAAILEFIAPAAP